MSMHRWGSRRGNFGAEAEKVGNGFGCFAYRLSMNSGLRASRRSFR